MCLLPNLHMQLWVQRAQSLSETVYIANQMAVKGLLYANEDFK